MSQTREPATTSIAWADGRVLPASEATVPLLDDGFLRGDAVFETILVREGRTHALHSHLDRMRRSARIIGVKVPSLRQAVTDLLAAWGERDGALKLIVTRSGTVRGVLSRPTWPASITLAPVETPWESPISGAKTVSYAPNQWATRRAQQAHADDAVVTVDGVVHEVPTAAVAWVREGAVHSPDPEVLPILDSVTLRELTAVADVKFGVHPLEDLLAADEVFVLSATRPVLPVHAVGDVEYPAPGPRTRELRQAFDAHVQDSLDTPP